MHLCKVIEERLGERAEAMTGSENEKAWKQKGQEKKEIVKGREGGKKESEREGDGERERVQGTSRRWGEEIQTKYEQKANNNEKQTKQQAFIVQTYTRRRNETKISAEHEKQFHYSDSLAFYTR